MASQTLTIAAQIFVAAQPFNAVQRRFAAVAFLSCSGHILESEGVGWCRALCLRVSCFVKQMLSGVRNFCLAAMVWAWLDAAVGSPVPSVRRA